MGCSMTMDNLNLKAEKSVKFFCYNWLQIKIWLKLTFEKYINNKIHNTQHITSSYYSLRSQQYRIPDKTTINLYKTYIRPYFDHGNVALITAKTKDIYKWEKIQMDVLKFALNLS